MPSLFTSKNTKTIRGEVRGYETYVLHMAAADASGVADVCRYASPGCKSVCLINAGRLPMSSDLQTWRTRLAIEEPDEFYTRLYEEIAAGAHKAKKKGMLAAFRLNGTSDLPWERMGLQDGESIFDAFPDEIFYDYTKYPLAKRRGALKHQNYHLTYSWSEGPAFMPPEKRQSFVLQSAQEWLSVGVNTTAVFGRYHQDHGDLPSHYDLGFGNVRVIDGDEDDLRFLDPKGVIVGLRAKFKSYEVLERGIASGFILPGSYAGRSMRPKRNPPDDVSGIDEELWMYGIGCSGGQELDNVPIY